MERTLDKLFSSNATNSTKLHQSYDWTLAEKKELKDGLEAKKQRELDKFIIRANKKLASAAYKACDKGEYAKSLMDEKLQSYDVKQYLEHRRVNHKAVKAIFKAIKQTCRR